VTHDLIKEGAARRPATPEDRAAPEDRSPVPAERRDRRRRPKWVRSLGSYLLLLVVALVFLWPFLFLLSTALKPATQDVFSFPPSLVPHPPVITWFRDAWTEIPFPRYLLNSLLYVAIGLPLFVLVSAMTAYPLATMRFRGRTLMFFVFLSTMFVPTELMLIPRFLVVTRIGLTNSYAGVVLPGVLSAFGVFLLRQAFAAVPPELAEAARLDGCGEIRLFWNVILPVVRPTLAIASIFGFIFIWNDFIWPLVVLNDDSKYPIALGVAYLSGISGTDTRTLSAGTVISLVPIVLFFVILQRQVLEGAKGAVKG
jgi:putative chitobiose transport system permease protein